MASEGRNYSKFFADKPIFWALQCFYLLHESYADARQHVACLIPKAELSHACTQILQLFWAQMPWTMNHSATGERCLIIIHRDSVKAKATLIFFSIVRTKESARTSDLEKKTTIFAPSNLVKYLDSWQAIRYAFTFLQFFFHEGIGIRASLLC